jgi:hypothetical protein
MAKHTLRPDIYSMKYIRKYQIFESSAPAPAALTQEQIDWLDKCAKRKWKLNRQTGFVDVVGDFDCAYQSLQDFKGVRFGKVNGDFRCDNNQLTSLEGAPQSVGGDFWCGGNQLTSLEGAPQSVGGDFGCGGNQLTSLEGAPQSVKGSFVCKGNHLTSLEGAPKTVGGYFLCGGNPVSESTLDAIFELMKNGKSYQDALEKYWPKMADEDKALMYKEMSNLSPEDARKYKAMTTYNNIKGYL